MASFPIQKAYPQSLVKNRGVERPKAGRNEQVYQAAQMYEQQFLREMVKAMRQTVPESELMPASMGEKIYRDQLDDKYVTNWTDQGGIGLSDLIYEHIMERYAPRGMNIKPKGPLPMEDHSRVNIQMKDEKNKTTTTIQLKEGDNGKPLSLVAPWRGVGRVIDAGSSDLKFFQMEHDNGLKSTFAFDGLIATQSGPFEAGQKIGTVSPDSRGAIWSVDFTA